MDLNKYTELVRRYFNFLLDEYGFKQEDQQYNAEAFGNAYIDFRSKGLVLRVSLDRGILIVNIRPVSRSTDTWFSLESLVKFLDPNANEPEFIFPEKWDHYDDMVENQIQRMSRILSQYCDPILSGEFSQWKKVDKMVRKQARRDYRKITGKNPPF